MSFFSDGLIKKLEKELKAQASSRCFSVLAQIYYEQGDYKRAEKLCLDGLKYHPSHLSAFLLLADIYMSLDKNDKASQYLNRAKIISPEHPKIYEKLARLYTRQNKMEESIEAYKTLLILRPDHPVALDMLSYLEPFVSSKEVEVSTLTTNQNLDPKEEVVSVDLEEKAELKEKVDILEELEKIEQSIFLDLTKKNTLSDDLEKENDEGSSLDNKKKQLSLEKASISKKETDSIVGKSFGIETPKSNPTQSFKPKIADPKNSMLDIETLLRKESKKSQKSETTEENKTKLKKQKVLKLNQMLVQVENYIQKSIV